MRPSGLRTGLCAAWLAGLWLSGGVLAFLIGPVLSRVHPAWGALVSLTLVAAQAVGGERLLRSLLRLQPDPTGSVAALADEERPFLVALGRRPDLVATRGLLEGPAEDLQELSQGLLDGRGGVSGALLSRFLALPCLLRAFEATVAQYGRLRGGTGPLFFLGRAFLALAHLLEAPLRPLVLPAEAPDAAARVRLRERLARYATFPAWMEALDLLAPVGLAEVRLQARLLALGGPQGAGWPGREARRDWPGRVAPWCGLALGIALASRPGGPLAAPVVLLALGMVFRICWDLPLTRAQSGDPLDLWIAARGRGRALPVRWQGRIADRPDGLAVPEGTWLEVGSGRILLVASPAGQGAVEVSGWLMPHLPEVLVGTLSSQGRVRRTLAWTRRLLVPAALGLLGATWWILQWVGL